MNKAMMSGRDSMRQMKMSGDTDKDFAMMMRVHHQQAFDMAQVEIDRGKSAEMKSMAEKIVAAQKKEIAEFDRWLKAHPQRLRGSGLPSPRLAHSPPQATATPGKDFNGDAAKP